MAQIIQSNNWWGGGWWGWDMQKSVYDPNNVNANAFDYDNFINTPTIPAAQVQSDWDEEDNTQVDYIKNKPTIPAAQIQSDWDEADNTKLDYIKNKPTIPAAQVQSDWSEADNTKVDFIKNKPTIPTVIDALNSTSTTSALSANQGKVLNDKISDLFGLWKFLSTWDATTGQPDSFPLQTPYTYTTWDYYLVSTISSATPPVNYKPSGSSYTWTASSTTESEELAVWDIYIYDGTNWLLQLNHWKTVSFSEIAWNATDNTSLSNALALKQNTLSTQTVYTAQGSATKVPQITTNSLWQVTNITEVTITQPDISWLVTWPASSTDWHLAVFDWATGKIVKDWWAIPVWDIAYSQFETETETSWATLTISHLTTLFEPTEDFTISCWTVKEWMQYILRIDSWATAYNITLWTWITNPFWEDLTLTASKMTTMVFLATSSSSLELFSIRTAE